MSRIVHINADMNENGGAELAMQLLMDEERQAGHEVIAISRAQIGWRYRILHLAARAVMKSVWRRCYSGGFLPTGLAQVANAYRPDVVYLHRLQNGTIGMRELNLIKAEMRWFMHDCWPINGLSPFFDDAVSNFPVPKSAYWLAKLAKKRKRRAIVRIKDRLTIEVASKWMERQVLDFMRGEQVKICVRPLPLRKCFSEHMRFKREDLPSGRFAILFGAANDVWGRAKGFDRLLAAIKVLPADIRQQMELRVFGTNAPEVAICDIDTVCLGQLSADSLANEFCRAGILALPSRQETYSLTKHEALACGCPVIAFRETACAEGIVHGGNGFAVAPEDISGFAEGIRHFFNRWRNLKENVRR